MSAAQSLSISFGLLPNHIGPKASSSVVTLLRAPVVLLDCPQRLFQGFSALYARQSLSWVTFLVADSQLKQIVRRISHTEDVLSFPNLMVVAAGVGIIHTVVTLPIDFVKTQCQRFDTNCSTGGTSPPDGRRRCSSSRGRLLNVTRQMFKAHSIRVFYVGFYVRLTQYMLNSIFTVTLLEHLEFLAGKG